MNNKIATVLRILYSTGFPLLAMYVGSLIETKYSIIAFIALIMVYLLTVLYENKTAKNLLRIRGFEMRLLIWTLNLCIAPFIGFHFIGIVIYVFLFLITIITVSQDEDFVEIGEGIFLGLLSNKRLIIGAILFFAFLIFLLFTKGPEGLIQFHL
jgi:hypothetical protein